jgi:hypothetical protein
MGEPLNEKAVLIVARIAVLEYLVANLFNMRYGEKKLTMDEVKEEHRKSKAQMARHTNLGFHPAQSDLITNEMEVALENVFKMTEDLFERYSMIGREKP